MIGGRIVVKNDSVWQGHPDVAYFKGRIYVVYRESLSHRVLSETKINIVYSSNGNDFSEPKTILESNEDGRYNCPRLSVINNELYCVCDFIKNDRKVDFSVQENIRSNTSIVIGKLTLHGWMFSGFLLDGIVPDRLLKTNYGNFLIASHHWVPQKNSSGRLKQNVWVSDSIDGNWEKFDIADIKGLNLCEASIFKVDDKLVCLMRENSGMGFPAVMSVSHDGMGKVWGVPKYTRLFGCHRPVSNKLKSGKILTTYREQMFSTKTKFWARNTFACLTDGNIFSGLTDSIILPIDHDKSKTPDSGYTGWVQLPDNSIYIVNYITDDAPKAYIKSYIIKESDF